MKNLQPNQEGTEIPTIADYEHFKIRQKESECPYLNTN